jgi:serine phosphatase RsbU (regulator of sigma subunit)
LTEESNPSGDGFREDRLQAVVARKQELTLDESLDALIGDITAWHGSDRFSDDLSIAALEIHGK